MWHYGCVLTGLLAVCRGSLDLSGVIDWRKEPLWQDERQRDNVGGVVG